MPAFAWCRAMPVDFARFAALVREDRELRLRLGRLTALVRIGRDGEALDLAITQGQVTAIAAASGEADLVISAPDAFWSEALGPRPSYAASSLTSGGAGFAGDLARVVAPHYPAWERLLQLLRIAACPDLPAPRPVPDRRASDDAIGRYAYVRNGEHEARIYYETAGQGDIPLLLHATAGADGRQWRHMLTYPPLRARFRMIAYDLPGHGKSLPVLDEAWWRED